MRLSGLASGMDTDSMIKEMMKTERIKVDKLTQDKQILSWRQETFNSLNKDLVNFILDSKKKLGVKTSYSGAISYRDINWSKTATLNTGAKSTATASPSAMEGKHSIEVTKMAEGVTAVSKENITTGTKNDVITNQFAKSEIDKSAMFGKEDIIEFKIKGKNGEVKFIIGNNAAGTTNKAEDTDAENNIVRITKPLSSVNLSEIVSKINSATVSGSDSSKSLGMKASYDSNLDRFFIQTRDTGKDANFKIDATSGSSGEKFINSLKLNDVKAFSSKLEDGTTYSGTHIGAELKAESADLKLLGNAKSSFSIIINDGSGAETIDIVENETMEAIKDKIVAKGITADYTNGKLSINAGTTLTVSSTGVEPQKAASQSFLSSLGLMVSDSKGEEITQSGTSILGKTYGGINAMVNYSIDGVPVKTGIEYPSNSFTINGINFTANAADLTQSVDITIGTNTDEVYNKVKEFIDGYNKIVDNMNSLVSEKTYRSFKPLTSEEKEAMSEEEVKLWEIKARSGLVKGDGIISRTIQTVRSGLYDVVDGATGSYNHITQIGITTEKFVSGASGGKLEINEAKLKEAIAKDANGVLDLLFKSPEGSLDTDDDNLTVENLKSKRKQSGIITRIYHNLAAGMKEIVEKSGTGKEGNLLREVRARITQDFATKHSSRSLIDKSIFDYDKRIDKMNSYLSNREQFYYNKFTAMEKAMQSSSSQSSWLTQQLGGGQ